MAGPRFYFDPEAEGSAVFLGPTEVRLMELAWSKKRLSVKQAMFFLGSESDLAYTTVMTVLGRLHQKGLLEREKEGRNYVYTPTCSREEFVRKRVKTVRSCLQRNFKSVR